MDESTCNKMNKCTHIHDEFKILKLQMASHDDHHLDSLVYLNEKIVG
jgi:hypothetical protein